MAGLDTCHRSSLAGPAQAALELEAADSQRSVTFVHVACSGAEIGVGLLGNYTPEHPGYLTTPEWAHEELDAQIKQVREITCSDPGPESVVASCREIDALTISIGANDIGFAGIAADLVKNKPLGELEAELSRKINDLRKGLDSLAATLQLSLRVEPRNVYITEYPDIVHGEGGRLCDNILGELLAGSVSPEEAQWAYERVIQPLNSQLRFAATKHGWTLVGGIQEAFNGHGYCADGDQRWVRTARESREFQGPHHIGWPRGLVARWDMANTKGTLHPNEHGHAAIADLLFEEIDSNQGRSREIGFEHFGNRLNARPRITWFQETSILDRAPVGSSLAEAVNQLGLMDRSDGHRGETTPPAFTELEATSAMQLELRTARQHAAATDTALDQLHSDLDIELASLTTPLFPARSAFRSSAHRQR